MAVELRGRADLFELVVEQAELAVLAVDATGQVYALPRPADWEDMRDAGTPYHVALDDTGLPTWVENVATGRWEIVTNGDPDDPEVLFLVNADGYPEVVQIFVPGG